VQNKWFEQRCSFDFLSSSIRWFCLPEGEGHYCKPNLYHPKSDASTKRPDRTAVIVECKKYAVNRSATGKVDWNAFGTGDPRWIGNIATVFLSGKTKNEYGTKIPFTIECRGNQDGSIKLVKIVRQ
jgi:hypothetical protein